MRLMPMLAALLMPACSGEGAGGLPAPRPIDFTRLERPNSPNTALAAPTGFTPAPDIATHKYGVPPETLLAAARAVAGAQPRTYFTAAFDTPRQLHYVARTALLNFPDLVTVQVNDDSTLILWSRSVYGHSDFGVNRRRIEAWLTALDAALASRT